jgi:hypothetical protein
MSMMIRMYLLVIAFLACFTAVPKLQAQEGPWSLGAYYSFGRKDYAVVTSNKLATLDDFLTVKGFRADVNAFAGVSTSGVTLAGASITFEKQIAKSLYVFGGPGIDGDITNLKNISLGIHAGVRWVVVF